MGGINFYKPLSLSNAIDNAACMGVSRGMTDKWVRFAPCRNNTSRIGVGTN